MRAAIDEGVCRAVGIAVIDQRRVAETRDLKVAAVGYFRLEPAEQRSPAAEHTLLLVLVITLVAIDGVPNSVIAVLGKKLRPQASEIKGPKLTATR